MPSTSVGILGVGLYLPPEVRRNDWWPAEVVDGWMSGRPSNAKPPEVMTEGTQRVLAAMAKQAKDPFQGSVERRVLSPTMTGFDMQEHAARGALHDAAIDPAQIDLVLTHTVVPDFMLGNPACNVHHRLGLSKSCFTMETDAATYSFLMQLTIAESMIAAGRARYALLVQSCLTSPHLDMRAPIAPMFGDGASAVVVGPVTAGRGLLAAVHKTDGRFPRTLPMSVPNGRWFDEGRSIIHVGEAGQMQEVFLTIADVCKESIDEALAGASLAPSAVDFFCMHQGTPWLREVVRDYAALTNARSVETFAKTGYLFSAILPVGLADAKEQGLLTDDNVVVLVAGGPGMTYGATVLRWGR